MKLVKTLALTAFSLTLFACNGQERKITLQQLPVTAQAFIKNNFPNQATDYIIEDKSLKKTEYEVRFTGGAEIEFDGKGAWKEVDANTTLMPVAILPTGVTIYLNQNYKGQQVEKIEKNIRGYEVELANGPELKFDTKGNFLRIDD